MLSPYTVIDLTDERGELGPMVLGDLGADVIRVEPPGGSAARRIEPLIPGLAQDPSGTAQGGLSSLSFEAFNRNKRSIVLDPENAADQATLDQLLARADFVFESAPAVAGADFGISFERVQRANARGIYVRISAFGADGPHADFIGNDLVLAAMGGPVSLQGTPDRAPVKVSVPQVWRHAGVEAATGAMAAHARMQKTGRAQSVDLSAQAVMTWTMLQAMDAYEIQGFDFERSGSAMKTEVASIQLVHACADGYLVALPLSAVIRGCLEWMIDDGVMEPADREVDWDAFDMSLRDPSIECRYTFAEGQARVQQFFARHTKAELYDFGVANDITLAPVNSLPELLALKHLAVRAFWRDRQLANGARVDSPGLWAKIPSAPLTVRHEPPELGEHSEAIRAELNRQHAAPTYPSPAGDDVLPFEGLKVADFAWVGVGPISSKFLADHGAQVVRVESENRPDVLRGGGPFKDAIPGIDRSQFFGDFNTSKLSLTLDMKSAEALPLARKLIGQSDVLIESFAPGAIARMGLSYEEVSKLNPGLIMVSTCLMGQTGPAAKLAGYGYHAASLAGFYEVTGWPDQPPVGPWTAYTDTIAPRFVATLLAAALDHRRRTGRGCYIDLAQIETSLHFLGPEILDYQISGHSVTRMGNRSRFAAPQSCYPCAGEDQWCAIAIDTDEQFRAFATAIGQDAWLADESLATNAGRLAAHDTLDVVITAWTAARRASDITAQLQAVGVPAGPVQRSSDLLKDPQYAHRGFYHYYDHAEMGRVPYAGHQYRIANYDNGPRFAAPTLGQHSFDVLSNFLELSDEEVGQAFASGAIM